MPPVVPDFRTFPLPAGAVAKPCLPAVLGCAFPFPLPFFPPLPAAVAFVVAASFPPTPAAEEGAPTFPATTPVPAVPVVVPSPAAAFVEVVPAPFPPAAPAAAAANRFGFTRLLLTFGFPVALLRRVPDCIRSTSWKLGLHAGGDCGEQLETRTTSRGWQPWR